MSRFTDLFQPKPASEPALESAPEPVAPVVEKEEVVVKSNKVLEIGKWKYHKTK